MISRFSGALGAAASLSLTASPAFAHITLDRPDAAPRSGTKLVFRVTHGCDGAATTAVTVTIPEGIIAAKPMPKPGWAVDIAKGDYARSYDFYHGKTLAKGAKTITWKGGSLPDDMYDEFVVSAFVSDAFKPGALVAIPVVQTCAGGTSLAWTQVPKAGESEHDLTFPAPELKIIAGTPVEHHH